MVVTDLRFSDDPVMKDLDFVLCFQRVHDLPFRSLVGYQSSAIGIFLVFLVFALLAVYTHLGGIHRHSAMGRMSHEAKGGGFHGCRY